MGSDTMEPSGENRWPAMRWAIAAWIGIAAVWLLLTVQNDLDEKAQASLKAGRAFDAEMANASCMTAHMTDQEKALMAVAVAHQFKASETEAMWSNLIRVGQVCHVDRADIVSRAEWPSMFNELAAADALYREDLRLNVAGHLPAP